MELGEKLLLARQEAGLSQRQLCDGIITRNMLSLIEHGTARPSMDTLRALAVRLDKPLSWFLEEDALASPNYNLMIEAREAFRRGDHAAVQSALEGYRSPDLVFDEEFQLLVIHTLFAMAEQAVEKKQYPFAKALLDQIRAVEPDCLYTFPELERKRLLLLAQAEPRKKQEVCDALPSLDAELLLRAEAALENGSTLRAIALLEAMEQQENPQWLFLRGRAAMETHNFSEAAHFLHRAEGALSRETAPLLEQCYRELEDYKQAYFYACKQK